MIEEEIDTLMNLSLACFRSDGVLAVQAKKKAQAREEADREEEILWAREVAAREAAERNAATHPVSQREEARLVASEWGAREAAARETKAYIRSIEKWRETNPPVF